MELQVQELNLTAFFALRREHNSRATSLFSSMHALAYGDRPIYGTTLPNSTPPPHVPCHRIRRILWPHFSKSPARGNTFHCCHQRNPYLRYYFHYFRTCTSLKWLMLPRRIEIKEYKLGIYYKKSKFWRT